MKLDIQEISSAVREITVARAQISDSISLLEKNLPKIQALDTVPAVQTINSLKRSIRAIDRIVRTTPQRLSEKQ